MIPHNPFQQLCNLDRTSPRSHEQLRDFLRGDAYRDALQTLQGEDLASLVEYLNNVLVDMSDRAAPVFQDFLRELREICGVKEVLPKSWNLPESLLGCVYKGTFNGSKVRIRRVRTHAGGDPRKIKESFHKVAVISKGSAHPNIVPLLGVTMEPLELISDWMPGGELPRYITKHPDANRLSLLSDVAEGLSYLHSCDMIHGNLKSSNILVDATDHARITDFGLAMFTQDLDSMWDASAGDDQSPRWIAPEVLRSGTYSKEADIFSYAGVAIEAFTSAAPFSEKPFHEAKCAIERGERPPRPTYPTLTDEIWLLIQRCWDQKVHLRPHALKISCALNGTPAWKPLINRPLTSSERGSLIADIFSDNDDTKAVRSLCGDDAQSFVDVIDEMLDTLSPSLQRKCLDALRTICGRQALLPRSVQITPCYDRLDDPQYRGGYADVWKGDYEGRKVAVKVLRIYGSSNLDKIISKFCKEVIMWKSLDNPNVLPLLGATMSNKRFTMISEWMDNRNIGEFVKAHKSVNRFELLKDVTSGLVYLHKQEVIHGDLKGANILIDRNRHACLADFGLLTFATDPTNLTAPNSTASGCGTIRWMSPELLDPEKFGFRDSRTTKESDYYALGMVIFEVLSGQAPFAGDRDFVVVRKVVDGERPRRPEEAWLTNDIWGILESCWVPKPQDRPSLEAVLRCLEKESASWTPHPVPSTPNSSKRGLPDQDRILAVDVSQVGSPSLEVVSQSVREPTIHCASSVPDSTQTTDGTPTQSFNRLFDDLTRLEFDIEHLDKALDNLPPTSFTFKWAHRKLQRVCVFRSLLPSSHVLSSYSLIDESPFVSSCFSDEYRGTCNGLQVCIKRLRVASDTDSEEAKKILFQEALMWKRLTHPNVVPFVGVTIDPPQIVSRWMPGGNLTTYIESNPHRDRISLLMDIAKGLDYIHSYGVIHGDLKGPNILVDVSGNACITNFCLAQDTLGVVSMPARWSMQWTAPEILVESGKPSTEADVFSFGMVMAEAFTGSVPFGDRNSSSAMIAIISGKRPPRPTHSTLTDSLWELMNRCWDQDRHNRPRMLEVILALNPLVHEYTRPSGRPPVTADVPTLVSDTRQRLENTDSLNEEYRPLLHALLSHRDLKAYIDELQSDDLQRLVELLDKALNRVPGTDHLFRKVLRRLQSTCGDHEALPRSYLISGRKLFNRDIPFAAGGSVDAQEAEFNGKKVCIKALGSHVPSKTFYKGVIVWKRLRHPNIVPFLGIPAEMPPFEIVYDWMEYGRITEYVRKYPDADRINLLWGVAEGLHHLHSYHIVHGNLKGENILIDKNGQAHLTGFGLTSIVLGNRSEVASLPDASLGIATTWAAPEISEGGSVTKEGDVFAFAMVAAETFSEHFESVGYHAVVSTGERPQRPGKLNDDLWNLMQECWNQDPRKRPTTFELVDFFRPLFLREQGTSKTQTVSSVLTDETSAHPEGRNTGKHSGLSVLELRTVGGEVRKVPENPRPSGSKPPRQGLSGGDNRPAAITERKPSTPTRKSGVPSRRWPLKFRPGGS